MLINEGNPVQGGGVPGYSPYQDPDLICCWEDRQFEGTARMPCTGPMKRKITLEFSITIDRFCADCDCARANLGKYGTEVMAESTDADGVTGVDWTFNFHTVCEVKPCAGSGDKRCSEGYPKTIGPFKFTLAVGKRDYGTGEPWPPAVHDILGGRSHKNVKVRSDRPKDEDGEQLNPEWPTPKGPGQGLRVPPHPKGEDLPSTDGAERCCPEDDENDNDIDVARATPKGGFCT